MLLKNRRGGEQPAAVREEDAHSVEACRIDLGEEVGHARGGEPDNNQESRAEVDGKQHEVAHQLAERPGFWSRPIERPLLGCDEVERECAGERDRRREREFDLENMNWNRLNPSGVAMSVKDSVRKRGSMGARTG